MPVLMPVLMLPLVLCLLHYRWYPGEATEAATRASEFRGYEC